MTDEANNSGRTFQVEQRAAAQMMMRRRRRVATRVGLFVGATAVMVLLSLAHRDSLTVRTSEAVMATVADAFNADYVDRPLPPALLPETQYEAPKYERIRRSWRDRLVYAPDAYFRGRRGAVGAVCYSANPIRRYLGAEGRHVLLFDGAQYSVRWVTEEEFEKHASEWGVVLNVDATNP